MSISFACAVLAIVALFSLPAIRAALIQLCNHQPKNSFYEDDDGCSTSETIANFSNRNVKTTILIFSALGSGSSVAILFLSLSSNDNRGWNLELGLFAIAWGFILIHASCIAANHSPVKSHNLGIWLLASALILTSFPILQSVREASRLYIHEDPVAILWIVNILTSLSVGISSTLLPRRPDVVFEGCDVDRQRSVSALSRYTWSWIQPLLCHVSVNDDIEVHQISCPDRTLRSRGLKEDWDGLKVQANLGLTLMWAYKKRLLLLWTVTLFRCLVSIVPFWSILQIIRTLEDQERGYGSIELLSFVVVMGLSNLLDAWMEGWAFWYSVSDLALPIRAQLSSLVFSKSLRRKIVRSTHKIQHADHLKIPSSDTSIPESRQDVMNLVGVDGERISYFFQFQFLIINGILKLGIFSIFLVQLIGWIPFGAGILSGTLVLPASTWFSNLLLARSASLMKLRDAKLTKVNEALFGIRQIKLSALESQWEEKILALRNAELGVLWKYFVADSALFGCWVISPILLAATSLAAYVLVNGNLLPSVAFVSIGMFSTLESTLGSLPELITLGIDTLVSVNRIQTYQKGPEIQRVVSNSPEISFKDATVCWPADRETAAEDRFALHGLNLSFPRGHLSVILGKTGSGKSLLVSAILGEADLLKGSVSVPEVSRSNRLVTAHQPTDWVIPGLLAYVCQTPWLENGSLRDNILFGLPYIKERYDRAIEACALRPDLAILTDGDRTELVENGMNISGGQRWRVTFARAIYSRAEILILEDIFCAVDAPVGRWIFDKCLVGDLCKSRTRILITHNMGLAQSQAEYLVQLEEGTAKYSGCPKYATIEPGQTQGNQGGTAPAQALTALDNTLAVDSNGNREQFTPSVSCSPPKPPRKLVQEETREKGHVKRHVYLTYLKSSGGMLVWCACAIAFIAYQIGTVGRGWWLRIWTTQNETINPKEGAGIYSTFPPLYSVGILQHYSTQLSLQQDVIYYLNIYVVVSLATAIIGVLRFFWVYLLAIKASKSMFEKLVFTMLHVPLRWVENVPTGRIINRFTADFNIVDQRIPLSCAMFFGDLLRSVGICAASFCTSVYLLPPAILLFLVSSLVGKRYLAASRPLKRLENNARSPVFDLFNATLVGISTIRAFETTDTYLTRMHNSLDSWTMTTFYTALANRWMSFRMALVAACFCVTVGIVIVFSSNIDAALAGFALSFMLDFSESIRWTIRYYGDMELDMSSTERVVEYMNLETEPLSGSKPPAAWPTSGAIELNNLEVAYGADLPPVLKGISFRVRHNERVGIVGRTGAGKSSLALALFRFLETRSGSIVIDGLDISKLTLHDLRSRLAIIPQDPVLFSGTIRSNLDPFNVYTDSDIFEALKRVQLIETEPEIPIADYILYDKPTNIFYDLSSPISESGGNLSLGQRQLLCIARAIITRPKIIVFDEATSAVDVPTDSLVQDSIRDGFNDSTLIVIAHRLSTVADFDKILVIEDGCMVEFGPPRELWQRRGTFHSMCEMSSHTEKEKLKATVLGNGE